MPPLVIPNTVRINQVWQAQGVDTAVNVMHVRVGAATVIDQAFANQVALDLGTAATPFLTVAPLTAIGAGWRLDRCGVRDLRTPNQPEWTAPIALNSASGGVALPFGMSIVGTIRTALAGRSYRGRIYLPGWSIGATTINGQISTAASAKAQAYFNDLYVRLDNAGNPLAVASPTLGLSTIASSIVVRDDQWDTQRRRNRPGI